LYRIIDECASKSSLTKPSSVFNNIKKEKKRRFIYLFIYWVGGGGGIFLFVHAALLHSHSWHASDNKNKLSSAPSDKTFPPTLLGAGVVLLPSNIN